VFIHATLWIQGNKENYLYPQKINTKITDECKITQNAILLPWNTPPHLSSSERNNSKASDFGSLMDIGEPDAFKGFLKQ
jgi:hypothetical protein